MIINPYVFAAAGNAVEVQVVGSGTLAGSGSTKTLSGTSFGAAAADREVVAAVRWLRGPSSISLVSATIGGVAATIHVQRSDHPFGAISAHCGIAIISALVPTGTTGNVVCTFGNICTAAVHLYRVVNLISRTPEDTLSVRADDPGDKFVEGTIDAEDGGAIFVETMGYPGNDPGGDVVGFDVAYGNYELYTSYYAEGGYYLPIADETGRTVSIDINGTSSVGSVWAVHMVGVSFR